MDIPGLEEFCKLGHFLSWNEYDMLVFLTSKAPKAFSLDYYVNGLINCCPCFVVDRGFCFWLIDDADVFTEDALKHLAIKAEELSKGLKHPFVFCYTPNSKVEALLKFLLNVITSQKQQANK